MSFLPETYIAFVRDRLRGILVGVAVVMTLISVTLVTSPPSSKGTAPGKIKTTDQEGLTTGPAGSEVVAGPSADPASPGATAAAPRRRASAGSSVARGSGGAPLVGGLGPGVTTDSIRVGFITISNNSKMLGNYGVRGGAIGDTREQIDAVVADLNSRGILGRKIAPVYRDFDATPGLPDQFPTICTAFTQDEKVFAVLSPWNTTPAFHACLAKAGTLYITDGLEQEDIETIEEFKPYIATGLFASSRGAVALAHALHQQGFFAPGTKLGIVRTNTPTGQRVSDKHFKPALASFGVTPVDETTSGLNKAGSDAAQRFAAKGIDRVAFITARGGPALGFMAGAQSQGNYNPRYGLASPDGPAFLAQNAPYTQMQGAVGAGWMPGGDVLDAEGPPFTDAEKRCLEVHKKAGTDYGTRNEGAMVALLFCDIAWLFEEAAVKAGSTLNAGSWAAGLAQLGTSHQTAATFGTNFAPGIFDGAFQFRALAYDDSPSCRCFRYTGPPQNVPR